MRSNRTVGCIFLLPFEPRGGLFFFLLLSRPHLGSDSLYFPSVHLVTLTVAMRICNDLSLYTIQMGATRADESETERDKVAPKREGAT